MHKKITLKITGMECPNCSFTLEQIEDRLAGVVFAQASYRKGSLVVEFDDGILSVDQIRAEVNRLGYQVGDIQ